MLKKDGFDKSLDELFSLPSKYDLEDFVQFGDHNIVIAVPPDSPSQLKRNILAAAKAYYMRVHSIDYVLKKYGASWDLETQLNREQKLLEDMFQDVMGKVNQTIEWMNKIDNKPDKVGLFTAGAALIRLETSFKAAKVLIKRGYNFESLDICRLILEQIAWAYNIHELEDETVFKILPTKSIAKLKNLLTKIGHLYGLLSKEAHMSPHSSLRKYIKFTEPYPQVVLATTEDSVSSAFILLLLADVFSIVTEYIYRELVPALSCLVKDGNGKYCVNKSRPFSQVIKHYKGELSGQ